MGDKTMKKTGKRLLSLLLIVLLLFGLCAQAFALESSPPPEESVPDEQKSAAPEQEPAESEQEPAEQNSEAGEEQSGDAGVTAARNVKVIFSVPEGAAVTVFSGTERDAEGQPLKLLELKDVYTCTLSEGSYYFSAACDGFKDIVLEAFTVKAPAEDGESMTVFASMEKPEGVSDGEAESETGGEPIFYSVSFYYASGDEEPVSEIKIKAGEPIGELLPEAGEFSKEDKLFSGWFFEDEEVTAETVVTADMSVFARYASGSVFGGEDDADPSSDLKQPSPMAALPISAETELKAVVEDLNANGGEQEIELSEDVALSGTAGLALKNGKLTILGEGHKLTAYFTLSGSAVLNLGKDGYGKTLQVVSNNASNGIVDLAGSSVLNLYNGVTIGPSRAPGMAGGVSAHATSTFNMYGGSINDCKNNVTVSGGVYLDGNAVFNMRGGTIENCSGLQGGAVGLSGAAPIGGSPVSSVTFNMYGGTIRNCVDGFVGGGAVCAWTTYPVAFNMYGGTIENCSSTYYRYGGAVCIYTTSATTFHMEGGTIKNSSGKYGGGVLIYATGENTDINFSGGTITGNDAQYGGGVFVFQGNVTVADGFHLHNNTATAGGDDIYNNGANVTLGAADTSATLIACGDPITGWFEDAEERWSMSECTGEADHLVPFEHVGELCTEEYGLKAAHGLLAYTIHFDPNEGTGDMEDMPMSFGVPANLTANSFNRENYLFDGWNTAANGSGTSYADQAEVVDLTDVAGSTVILYAQWRAKPALTITAASQSWTYDGAAHTNPSVTLTSGTLPDGDELVAQAEGSVTNVADTAEGNNPVAAGYKIMRGTTDVTDQYAITALPGTLTITPAALTITAKAQSFTYNGLPQGEENVSYSEPAEFAEKVTVSGLQGSDELTGITLDGTETDAGTYNGRIVPSAASISTAAENYTISYVGGSLTIKPATLTIKTASARKTYDGTALTKKDGYTLDGLQNGETVTFKVTGSQTQVGSSKNTYTLTWDGTAKKSNYVIREKLGTLEVVSVPLTGDQNDLHLWVMLFALSMCGTLLSLSYIKRRGIRT